MLEYSNRLSAKEYCELRSAVGWQQIIEEQAQSGIEHSDFIIACRDNNGIVGCARVFWDKGYIAYLADVMVKPEYQKQGIGKRMVNECISFIDRQLKDGWRCCRNTFPKRERGYMEENVLDNRINFRIEKINASNYSLFDDMIFWREKGFERDTLNAPISEQLKKELANPNLYIYAANVDNRYVGWISLIYMPKIGKQKGHGHVYVDELWVAPNYRGQGVAKALMKKADELKRELDATAIRLYVNVNNPIAKKLYESCGYMEDGQAHFMEK